MKQERGPGTRKMHGDRFAQSIGRPAGQSHLNFEEVIEYKPKPHDFEVERWKKNI